MGKGKGCLPLDVYGRGVLVGASDKGEVFVADHGYVDVCVYVEIMCISMSTSRGAAMLRNS